jgi:hypothetical protein
VMAAVAAPTAETSLATITTPGEVVRAADAMQKHPHTEKRSSDTPAGA